MDIQTPSLLITDDDQGFRDTLCGAFSERGFHTIGASDGEEALEIVQKEAVHLVLLDYHMPRLTGLQTLRELRRQKLELPCILISAGMDDALTNEAVAADAFSVLKKPVSFVEIKRCVQTALLDKYQWTATAK